MKKTFILTLLAFGTALVVSADDAKPAASAAKLPPASTKTGVTFATDIKPIFDAACIKCHGDKKPGHGIVLTSLESTLKGGKDGKIIVVGDSTKGDLIESIAHLGDPQSFMPKGRNAKPLTPDQIGLIRAWIDQGAK
ncbi:MAG TPA: c-type cytochrome domain-containing protein [Verrucomicrobiae bacterium]|nr:c-type cytochrome domain-containing protein [Verrucomicrobiae bacterium]